MNEPTVCAVMLVDGREDMVKRAVQCFRQQTYSNAVLLLSDSGPGSACSALESLGRPSTRKVAWWQHEERCGLTIGALRNLANEDACEWWGFAPDIIVHWDSDDWSHPNRIAEQAQLLQVSRKECVGYRDMLFWREDRAIPWETVHCFCGYEYARSGAPCYKCGRYPDGEAWLYNHGDTRYCLGTSLCYWQTIWAKRPFENLPGPNPHGAGEDWTWLQGVDSLGIQQLAIAGEQPRMIASVSDRMRKLLPLMAKAGDIKRSTQWDEYCRERMAL